MSSLLIASTCPESPPGLASNASISALVPELCDGRGVVTSAQPFLCVRQSAFWHSLEQYTAVWQRAHALKCSPGGARAPQRTHRSMMLRGMPAVEDKPRAALLAKFVSVAGSTVLPAKFCRPCSVRPSNAVACASRIASTRSLGMPFASARRAITSGYLAAFCMPRRRVSSGRRPCAWEIAASSRRSWSARACSSSSDSAIVCRGAQRGAACRGRGSERSGRESSSWREKEGAGGR
mmetsp:Transcript_9691/g.24331  ORF Transcript_9691/g.24331 Transcript_9691/m.24331 type:complete len:236 (+) Transcript_9691:1248-1955(+)